MSDLKAFSGTTAAGNRFTIHGDPAMPPEMRQALEKMVDLAYAMPREQLVSITEWGPDDDQVVDGSGQAGFSDSHCQKPEET